MLLTVHDFKHKKIGKRRITSFFL